MSYTFPITPHAMFEDRFEQFAALGLPRTEVEEMRSAITDMWSDAPGGWVFEWSRLALRHWETQQPYMAAVAYGWAKFPCLANNARRQALADQVTAYLAAAPGFPVKFERRIVATPFAGGTAKLPVHLYSSVAYIIKNRFFWSAAASIRGKWTSTGYVWSARNALA